MNQCPKHTKPDYTPPYMTKGRSGERIVCLDCLKEMNDDWLDRQGYWVREPKSVETK